MFETVKHKCPPGAKFKRVAYIERIHKILSGQCQYEDQQFDLDFQAKGSRDIEGTLPGTDRLTGSKQYAPFFKEGHNKMLWLRLHGV